MVELKLKEHKLHNWIIIDKPSGPHVGKIVCNTCGGKFVSWIPKDYLTHKGGGPDWNTAVEKPT